nr:hypothetical protein [Candidatus Sigynarchaeota archaeon]
MKIEVMNINFALSKLQHVTSAGITDIKMKNSKLESLPAVLAYIEDYAEKNGFTLLNGSAEGSGLIIFLVKK